MTKKDAYVVIDVGTGNVRVAVVTTDAQVLSIAREDIHYASDTAFADALYFHPEHLWQQILKLTRRALADAPDAAINAFTGTSQREGIVVLSKTGESLIGLPNIDHRGHECENMIRNKDRVYKLTGRYPTSLFSALKVIGLKEKRADIWDKFATFLSISDWVEYKLCGVQKYEHSQASETLLYDVAQKQWSDELCNIFGLQANVLPVLADSGTVLSRILAALADQLHVPRETVVVCGGGDTQLAIKSTNPSVEDVVIVSGTTTPVVKLVDQYILDKHQRTWTSRDVEKDRFVFEANAGVTGLNYQRLKEVFYPNEDYATIEKELAESKKALCVASLGSLIADENKPLTRGGFIFPAPVTHELKRSSFVWATMFDIACAIRENYRILSQLSPHRPDYIWTCGGGLQSGTLRQLIANLCGKKVKVRDGFQFASVVGGALICNEALGVNRSVAGEVETIFPDKNDQYGKMYEEWRKARKSFIDICARTSVSSIDTMRSLKP